MSGFLRALLPIKPTKQGRAIVVSEHFQLNCVQRIDRATPTFITRYEEVEPFVRNIVVRTLMPQREYCDQERIDFCTAHVAEVNAAVLPVVNMFLEFSKNPKEFARRILEKQGHKLPNLPVANDVPHDLFDGHEALADQRVGEYVDVDVKKYDARGLKKMKQEAPKPKEEEQAVSASNATVCPYTSTP